MNDMMSGRRSVFKGELSLGPVAIPIALYKVVDPFGIETHTYHEDCGDRVSRVVTCQKHPRESLPTTYQAVDFGDVVVRLNKEDRAKLLEQTPAIEFVSAHRMTKLAELINSGKAVPISVYRAMPVPDVIGINKNGLTTLLERMRVKKRFIVCTIAMGSGIKRHMVLLPTGMAYSLAYMEEIRPFPNIDGTVNRDVGAWIDENILAGDDTFDPPSAKTIMNRAQRWFAKRVKDIMAQSDRVAV